MIQRPWIVNRTEERDSGSSAEGELVQVQFAQKNGTGVFQTHYCFSVFGRNTVFKHSARRSSLRACCVDIVLKGDWNTVQRASQLASFLVGFHLARGCERLVSCHRNECVD